MLFVHHSHLNSITGFCNLLKILSNHLSRIDTVFLLIIFSLVSLHQQTLTAYKSVYYSGKHSHR